MLDDAMLESLEELLIQSDMGVETSLKVAAAIAEGRFGRRVGAREIREVLAGEIAPSSSRWRGRCRSTPGGRRWCWWWG